jgi:predicted metal-binding protein
MKCNGCKKWHGMVKHRFLIGEEHIEVVFFSTCVMIINVVVFENYKKASFPQSSH